MSDRIEDCICSVEDGKVKYCSLHFAAPDYLKRLIKANAALTEQEAENKRLLARIEELEAREKRLVDLLKAAYIEAHVVADHPRRFSACEAPVCKVALASIEGREP